MHMKRREFLKFSGVGLGALVAGCQTTGQGEQAAFMNPLGYRMVQLIDVGAEPFPVERVDIGRYQPAFYPQRVSYVSGEPIGTIIIHTPSRFLYLQETDTTAIRYATGVGREGFDWEGVAHIRRKARWPTWTPTTSMIEREPELVQYRTGMPPGPENPLGARALYLYQGDRDTLYRIHGTHQPWSIGQALSSGCIRLMNQHIIDLYERVPLGTKVVVQQV